MPSSMAFCIYGALGTRAFDKPSIIHYSSCMKTITINVSEPVYRDFREYARQHDRTASEIIREAMEDFRTRKIHRPTSLKDIRPVSVGKVLLPFTGSEDMLEALSSGQGD
jgi:hypothetical protein